MDRTASVDDLLPVLVADLAEESALTRLRDVARAGGDAWVPLVTAPMQRSPHRLEVYTPASTEALVLLAEPLGPPGELGFPLRLFPWDDASVPPPPPGPEEAAVAAGAPRKPTHITLTAEHERDLAGASPSPASVTAGAHVGRALAGGKLEIESLLGTGSIGAVYRARHRDLRIPIAVKVLREELHHDVEFCQRFYAEALAASRLDHPNVVRVYDFGQEPDGLLYFSMELLEGITLRALVDRGAGLSTPRIAEIMLQVCAGLAHAHGKGILHRALEPASVVLVPSHDDDGRLREVVKVTDFGIARGPGRGEPEYMSPEQRRGEPLDARTDVYACGVLLNELASGRAAGEAVADVDPRLEAIVVRATSATRGARHASMRELFADLRALSEDRTPPPGASIPPSSPMMSIPPPAPAPVVLATTPPPSPARTPDWLEDRSAGYARFLTGMSADVPAGEDLVDVLARDPKPWLARFVAERDPRAFADRVAALDRAVRVLAHRADARALWAVSSALHGVAGEASCAAAQKLLPLFADPGMLGPIAARLLAKDDGAREAATELLLRARVAGAYALYGARVKLATEPHVRAPFVATMRALGADAWPVVRAALEKIPPAALTGEHPLAADLAEDLLLSVPSVRDDAAGHVVRAFVRADVPALCLASARALARLWADRARPLLLALLADDEGKQLAAVAGLRELGAVDEHSARRLGALVAPGTTVSDELRASALSALAAMTVDARPIAVPILVRVLRDPDAREDSVLVAAQALASVMGREAMSVIHDRAERSVDPLRSRLHALVHARTRDI